jgi:hypothetical protein
MKSPQWLPAGFFLIVLAATVVGQTFPALPPPPGDHNATSVLSSPSRADNAVLGVDSAKGSPFSADVVYEFTQVLGDENRIHRESHGKIFRDSQGRIRNEFEDQRPRTKMLQITIDDPVTETFVTLSPETLPKTAVINHMTVVRDAAGRRIGVGVAARSRAADSGPAAGAVSPAELLERLKALQQAQQPVTRKTEQTPLMKGRKGKVEELGAKAIESFTASGVRFSITTPAGEIGNEKPLVTVNETWRSEELKAVLVSIYDNPQSGRRVMRLTNIQVGEPDSQLFQIPPDYAVREFPEGSKTVAKPPQ